MIKPKYNLNTEATGDLLRRARERANRHDRSWSPMMLELCDCIEDLEAAVAEACEVMDDLESKTDIYLGINDALNRSQEFKEKWDSEVRQCPGCSMAIYDDAAKDGWCTNCKPAHSSTALTEGRTNE